MEQVRASILFHSDSGNDVLIQRGVLGLADSADFRNCNIVSERKQKKGVVKIALMDLWLPLDVTKKNLWVRPYVYRRLGS